MEVLICLAMDIAPEDVWEITKGVGLKNTAVKICRSQEELEHAVRQTAFAGVTKDAVFRFPTKEGIHMVKLSTVSYFKGEDHRIIAHLEDGTLLRSRTMRISTEEAMRPLVESGQLLRIARTLYVNLEHLTLIAHNTACLRNGESLPISRSYCAKLRQGLRV